MKKILFLNFRSKLQREKYMSLALKNNLKISFQNFEDILIENHKVYVNSFDIEDFDIVFLGRMGEYLEIAKHIMEFLSVKKIPYFKYGATKDVSNKLYEYDFLKKNKFPCIETIFGYSNNETVRDMILNKMNYPLVIKPLGGAKGRGVIKVTSNEEFEKFKLNADPLLLYMFQEYIENDGDYRVFVLKNRILGVMKRESTDPHEFRSNISLGGKGYKSVIPKEIERVCLDIVKKYNVDIAGIDVIKDQRTGKYLIMEINHAPGFSGIEKYIDINVAEEIILSMI